MNRYSAVLLVMSCLIGSTHTNQLQKVYVHKALNDHVLQEPSQLELAKIVFYFSEKPIMHQIAHDAGKQQGWKHEIYFFTIDGMQQACRDALKDMQNDTGHYRITCTEVDQPRRGLRVELCYDPNHIVCLSESFDAITSDKGVVFRLINKPLLDQMSSFEKPLLQIVRNKTPRVVIDYGHGGHDAGAVGFNNIIEKDIAMQVGQKLAHYLREKGCDIFLTRENDHYVSLSSRTQNINGVQPDAYISIHANSAPRPSVHGIETYCLQAHLFASLTDTSKSSDIFQKALLPRYEKSRQLAESVHARLLQNLASFNVVDRKVRYSVSQLLLGTNVPGILVEVGFVTNPEEAVRLTQADYQGELARAMCDGLMACI